MRRLARREAAAAYAFLLPNAVGFAVFTALAVVSALLISLTDWDLLRPPRWVGFRNYADLLLRDSLFRQVLRNTVLYVMGTVPGQMFFGLLLAIALNRAVPGQVLFRTLFFLPMVSSSVAVAMVWRWLFNADFGPINAFLYEAGITKSPPDWLVSTRWALPALMIVSVWQGTGYSMVLFLAGLQGIPGTLYEAAAIDGATRWQSVRYITLPLLSPVTFFVLIVNIINSFQVFDLAAIMTEGGPANATMTIVYYIYLNGFQFFKMGYAAAVAWMLFALIFVATLLQFRLQRRWVTYDV